MCCKLLSPPFFFYSLLLSLSRSLRIFGLVEISCRCRGTESRHTVGHRRRSLADHRREEQTSKFTQGCVPRDSWRVNGSSYREPFWAIWGFWVGYMVPWRCFFKELERYYRSIPTRNRINLVTMVTSFKFWFRTLNLWDLDSRLKGTVHLKMLKYS